MSLANNLFDTRHLYEQEVLGDLPRKTFLDLNEREEIVLKSNEKIMCRNMIRKDFELIRIQDSFLKLFNDVEFFSIPNDDLLSVEHVAQIAFKRVDFQIDTRLYDFICDFGCQLAFDYKNGKNSELENIKSNAATLANLIFEASTFDYQDQALRYFLKEIIKRYPHLNLKHAKKYLKESNIQRKEQ